MKKIFLIICIILSVQCLQAQEGGVAIDAGYSFQFLTKPLSQGYIGVIGSYSKGNRGYSEYANQFLFGGGAFFGTYNGQKKFIPALTFAYGGLGLYKATITPYSLNPSMQLNFFNFMQLGVGYNIGYRKINKFNMNGFTISVNVAIGSPGHYINIST